MISEIRTSVPVKDYKIGIRYFSRYAGSIKEKEHRVVGSETGKCNRVEQLSKEEDSF
jgi:hypothetical protein